MTPAPPPSPRPVSRRRFLQAAGGCAAHLALLAGLPGRGALFAASPGARIVAREPWGRLEEVGPGVWALVSTPLEDRTTLCNGGIIAGDAGVVVVEAVATPRGATWLAEQARVLTGRWPDLVVVTHHHADHTGGAGAFAAGDDGPALRATAACLEGIRRGAAADAPIDGPLHAALARVTLLPDAVEEVELGHRRIRIVPRAGHTASDVTVEVDDPAVVFCGDLVWNGMFPNYVDATPSRLSAAVRALPADARTWVPGHGALADAADLARYRELLDAVEDHARAALSAGWSPAEAAERLVLPPPAREWLLFNPRYPERALAAWIRELSGAPPAPAASHPVEEARAWTP